jgi:eukaryotic-like serine/threonine-protein kinase
MASPVELLRTALADRYHVDREIAAGGMATVYLAHDKKHDRKVAIKVLKPELAAVIGGARFLAEIRTTANLQHPHILSLHDSGEVDGTVFYVMPFVDGESLRDRLTRERQLPIEDAIRIASEVADALQYAHDHGVIHRDIKPGNILLHGGHALVADFGIALAASTTGSTRMTETGVSLGTPTYMSPEQAMGERTLDARVDVYALGCVLYEMLVGSPPFIGSSAQAIVAKVLTEKPHGIVAQRDRVPEHVEAAILTSLEKLPADRFASAREFATALRDASHTARSGPARSASRAAVARRWVPITIGAAMLAIGVVVGRMMEPRDGVPETTRALAIALPDSARLAFNPSLEQPGGLGSLAMSPDGRRLAWVGTGPRAVRLYVRDMDSYTIRALDGTDGAFAPFFSTDGATLGFFTGHELRTVALSSGESRVLLPNVQEEPWGGAFLSDGRILYGTFFHEPRLVSPTGAMQPIALTDTNGKAVRDNLGGPAVAPGDVYAVGVARTTDAVAVLTLSTHELRLIERSGASDAMDAQRRFLRGSTPKIVGDRLVWLEGDVLMAATVDLVHARLTSEPVAVVSGVRGDIKLIGDFAVTADGTIVFVAGADPRVSKLAWLDHGGRVDTLPLPAADYRGWDVSPDGTRIVTLSSSSGTGDEVRVFDLARGISTKLNLPAPRTSQPVWTTDGRAVLLSVRKDLADTGAVLRIPVDGGKPDTISVGFASRYAVSRDGRTVILLRPSMRDVRNNVFTVSRDHGPFTPFGAPARGSPALSPDGRWLAYDAVIERAEVFVEPYPADGRRFQVSNEGGFEPIFSKTGDQIYYRNGRLIMSVPFSGAQPVLGKPTEYIAHDFADFRGRAWMLAPDGRFLIKLLPSYTPRSEIRVLSGALSPARLRAASDGHRK